MAFARQPLLRRALEGADDANWEALEELEERERWQREAQGEADIANLLDPRQLQKELDTLTILLLRADAIVRSGQQAKLKQLQEACDLWVGQRGQQLIIFSEFKDTLDHLLDCLAQWGYTTRAIHGGTSVKERRAAEKTFWEGKAQVLVATEAAGEGINLQCCHVLINFDIPWNPTRLDQRMGRIHRYGQRASHVFIFNLIARHTMEGEVKQALIDKQKEMAKDLGADKVFDVVDAPQTLGVSETPRVLSSRPAFEVTLPPDLGGNRQCKLIVSFWPAVYSDDDTVDGAVLYIAPGHWLLNALLDRVLARCAADLSQGAVFLDTQAESEAPALLWFERSQVRNGLDRHLNDLLAALRHRADLEQVARLPSEVLDGFDQGQGSDVEAGIHLVRPMLAGQDEVLEQCVSRVFLPELAQRRAPHIEDAARHSEATS